MHANRSARTFATLIVAVATALPAFPQTAAPEEIPYFYLLNTSTRMMAEVIAHRTDDGAPVILRPHFGGPSQQFSIQRLARAGDTEPVQDQWFLLRARHSGKCLKTNGFGPGVTVVQETCSGDASQLWRLRTLASGGFMARRTVLQNFFGRGRCMDAANGLTPGLPEQGNTLVVRECIAGFSAPNAVNQEWELVDVQDWDAPANFR
jgi:hypothetical protein